MSAEIRSRTPVTLGRRRASFRQRNLGRSIFRVSICRVRGSRLALLRWDPSLVWMERERLPRRLVLRLRVARAEVVRMARTTNRGCNVPGIARAVWLPSLAQLSFKNSLLYCTYKLNIPNGKKKRKDENRLN